MTKKVKEEKQRFSLRVNASTLEAVKILYANDNGASQNEFIEKAILFYVGYLSAEKKNSYLPNIVTSTLKGIVAESDNRQSRLLFKLAVEMAMMMNVLAYSQDIDKDSLERLRGECVKEVKKSHGTFGFEDALDWQKG